MASIENNIDPKDAKDLTKSLASAAQEMVSMAKYAEIFRKNICGAKDCLDEIAGKQKISNDLTKDSVDIAEEITDEKKKQLEQEKKIIELKQIQEKLDKEAKKVMEDRKKLMKAIVGFTLDIADDVGLKGVTDNVIGMVSAFKKGGIGLGLMATAMQLIAESVNLLGEAEKNIDKISVEIGVGGERARELAYHAQRMSKEMGIYGIGIEDANAAAGALSKGFTNLDYLTKENMKTVSLMAKQLGMSADESVKTLQTFMHMKGTSFENAKNTAVFAINIAKAANVPIREIMSDLASNSEAAAKYGGKFANSTIMASAMAKKMGISFGDIAKSAEGLLDIENSVEKQFEAQVLLGREINLEKARNFALMGDTLGVEKEILKHVGDEAEFNRLMPLQRQALADAIGIGVEQLGKMVSRQKEGLTAEQKIQEAQDKQTKSLDATVAAMEKMVGAVTQIDAAFKELGFAILKIFGADINDKTGKKLGTFAETVSKIAKGIQEWSGIIRIALYSIVAISIAKWAFGLYSAFSTTATASKAMAASSTGIKTFGTALKTLIGPIQMFFKALANPYVILGAAVFTGMMIGLGYALKVAAPGIEAFGKVIISVGTAIANVLGGAAVVITAILKDITLEKAAAVYALGAGFVVLAVGLGALTAGSLLTGLASFFGLDPSAQIRNLVDAVSGINATKAEGMKQLNTLIFNLNSLNPSNIKKSMDALVGGFSGLSEFKGVSIKSNVEYSNNQNTYNSESLKWLKMIAESTTVIASRSSKETKISSVENNDMSFARVG